jgi:hypothetical protein
MKEKDITQKVLEDNNDIFADIMYCYLMGSRRLKRMNLLIRQFTHNIRLKMEKFMNRNAILLSIGKEEVQT